jgi:hypothetical protein
MILNLSIGEEIEQDATELEGKHIPVESSHEDESHTGDVDEIEKIKAVPQVTSEAV